MMKFFHKLFCILTLPIVLLNYFIYMVICTALKKNYFIDWYEIPDNLRIFIDQWLTVEIYEHKGD